MKKKRAFTLIEIMIAIVVFSVGVLAVLRVLTGDLSLMDHTDMKLQSTVFGKEGLELLYNVRDSNFEKELPWNCIMGQSIYGQQLGVFNDENVNNSICSGYFAPGQIVQLGFNKDYYMVQNITGRSDDFDILFDNNQLCMFTGDIAGSTGMFWYSYCSEGEGEPTFFARYLSFTGIDISKNDEVQDQRDTILSTDKIMKVESHVLYKKGHNTGEYVFESFIGNY